MRYCSVCGTKLKKRPMATEFNTYTGKPLTLSYCPKSKWWDVFLGAPHSYNVYDD